MRSGQELDDQPRAADGDGVFDESGWRILLERRGQAQAEGVSAEGADDRAYDAGEEPTENGAVRRPNRGTADRAAQQPGAELHRHGATRRRRQLIADELAESEEHEDPRRPGVAEKGEPAAFQAEPPRPSGPADRRRRGERTETSDDADQKRDRVHVRRISRTQQGGNRMPRVPADAGVRTARSQR